MRATREAWLGAIRGEVIEGRIDLDVVIATAMGLARWFCRDTPQMLARR
jgi:hypothetical protein